jgi:hypothetical protein
MEKFSRPSIAERDCGQPVSPPGSLSRNREQASSTNGDLAGSTEHSPAAVATAGVAAGIFLLDRSKQKPLKGNGRSFGKFVSARERFSIEWG